MSDQLNAVLAVAQQTYGDLITLLSLEELERGEFGSEAKRGRLTGLLEKLNTCINTVERLVAERVAPTADAPVFSLAATHRKFYNDVLHPKGQLLQRAYFQISGLDMLVGLLDAPTGSKRSSRILDAITWSLERWSDMLNDDELFEWFERGFDIEGAQTLVAMPWFRPDEWSSNLKLLQPVLVDRSLQVLRDHVRYRLTEIYRAFSHGLWMAAIALSRSLVEFSLKTNAPRLGIIITYTGDGGRVEDKSLKRLGEEFSAFLPSLAAPIETVRETGNRILHPKKHDVVAHPKVMREEALECIVAARRVVGEVYSDLSHVK